MATVLVIEDDPDIRFAVCRALTRKEHTVTEVESGSAALARLDESRFDLVVTDLQLPDANGVDLIRAARVSSRACGVLVMTAYGSVETAVAAREEATSRAAVRAGPPCWPGLAASTSG